MRRPLISVHTPLGRHHVKVYLEGSVSRSGKYEHDRSKSRTLTSANIISRLSWPRTARQGERAYNHIALIPQLYIRTRLDHLTN